MRYEVSVHSYGRPMIRRGPMAGCRDFPQHKWQRINARPLGLKKAIALAESQAGRAVVTPWQQAGAVYDNGKEPAVPEGWLPEAFVREVA
jgi:hypothetical protein